MELLWTLLLALPTIFLAAFLASALENVRERRRTRNWVMRNLRQIATARFDSAAHIRAALQRWLEAQSPDDLSEEDWRHAWYVMFSNAPDLSPLLRSEAATSVPADLFTVVYELDNEITNYKLVEAYVKDMFIREVAPLWYDRRVPLSGADRLRVEWFVLILDGLLEMVDRTRGTFERFREAVRSA
jgi:hypothetical protein